MALAIFSYAEEARLFIRPSLFEGVGWRARKIAAGELASLLLGSLRDINHIALDPLPGVGLEPANRLLYLGRESFVDLLLREE